MRLYPIAEEDALLDALRLAKAMTYKSAMAGMAYGGGKAVIVGDPARHKTPALLTAYARAVDRLGGRFHTGTDMGLDGSDVAVMSRVTPLREPHGPRERSIDAADLAALGVLASIEQAARVAGASAARPARRRAGARARWADGWRDSSRRRERGSPSATSRPARVDEAVRELGAAAVAPGGHLRRGGGRVLARTPRAGCSTPPPSRACAAARWSAPPTSSSRTTRPERRCTRAGSCTVPTTS